MTGCVLEDIRRGVRLFAFMLDEWCLCDLSLQTNLSKPCSNDSHELVNDTLYKKAITNKCMQNSIYFLCGLESDFGSYN